MPLIEPAYTSNPQNARHIKISEVEYCGTNTLGRRMFLVSIKHGPHLHTATIYDPFFAKQEDELLWALEEFAAVSPYEADRAWKVSKDLSAYGTSLFEQLRLKEVFDAEANEMEDKRYKRKRPSTSWLIDVECAEANDPFSFHALHWESLEIPTLPFFEFRNIAHVCVRRKMPVPETPHPKYGVNIPVSIRSSTFNILLVSAHTENSEIAAKEDYDPMVIPKTMVDVFGLLAKNTIACPVRLEIVRPATWEALKAYLNLHGYGYYHLVHLDAQAKVVSMEDKEDDIYYAFDSEEESYAREWRSTARVGQLLVEYGVRFAVTNSPRTVRAGAVSNHNSALALVNSGLRGAVGLGYGMLEVNKARFFRSFYTHFCICRDFARAVHLARLDLFKQNEALGRFRTRVHVDDWISPCVYHANGTEVRVSEWETVSDALQGIGRTVGAKAETRAKSVGAHVTKTRIYRTATGGQNNGPGTFTIEAERPSSEHRNKIRNGATINISDAYLTRGSVNGREEHLRQIESKILSKSNFLKLTGAVGSGKSSVLVHLSWWWKTTHLIKDFFYFDYYLRPSLSVDSICRYMYTTLFPRNVPSPIRARFRTSKSKEREKKAALQQGNQDFNWKHRSEYQQHLVQLFPEGWLDKLVFYLRENPCLIVLDSIDVSMASEDGNDIARQEINEFFGQLKGGRTVAMFASNKDEDWISEALLNPSHHFLPPLEMHHALSYTDEVLEKYAGDPVRLEGELNVRYLERILQLCGRVPLVLELVLPSLLIDTRPMKQVYLHLLQGSAPLGTAQTAALYAVRSMRSLMELMEDLKTDNDSKRMLLCITPFWQVFPKNFEKYLGYLIHHRALPVEKAWRTSFDIMAGPALSTKDFETIHTILKVSGVAGHFGLLIERLQQLGLLTESKNDEYFSVHPLLTLFLRQEIAKEKEKADPKELIDYTAVSRAFVNLYKRYGSEWKIDPEEGYASVLDTCRMEETNILSAISLSVNFKNVEDVFRSFPLQTFARFAALVMADRTLGNVADALKSLMDLLIVRFEEFESMVTRSKRKLDSSSVLIALVASNWLCEYHSEFSAPNVFTDSVERSTHLFDLINAGSSRQKVMASLADIESQACKNKCFALQDGMLNGLTLRRPWSGLFSRAIPYATSFPRDIEGEVAARQLAMQFRGLHSLATQAHLSSLVREPLSTQLKKDLLILWRACLKQMRDSPLEVFLSSYTWVSESLVSAPALTPPPSPTIKFRTTPFLAYADILRAALYFYLQDPSAAKKTLETGILRAKLHSSADAELILQILLTRTASLREEDPTPRILQLIRARQLTRQDLDDYLHLLMLSPAPAVQTCLHLARSTNNIPAQFELLRAQATPESLVAALLLPSIPTHAKSEILYLLSAPSLLSREPEFLRALEPLAGVAGAGLEVLCEFLADARKLAEVAARGFGEEYKERMWEGAVRICLGEDGGEVFRGTRWSEGVRGVQMI